MCTNLWLFRHFNAAHGQPVGLPQRLVGQSHCPHHSGGIAWSHGLARDGFPSSSCHVGSQEFILGDVEGGSLLRVPCYGPAPAHKPPLISRFLGREMTLTLADPSLLACRSSACENSIKAALPVVKG